MSELGINVPNRGTFREDARQLGAKWVRLVVPTDAVPSNLFQMYREAGLKTLAVLARESFPTDEWARWAEVYVRRHGNYVDAWQVGNEPDLASPSSWTMAQDAYAAMLGAVAPAIRRVFPNATLVGAGGASGNPDYFRRGDILRHLDAAALHPYGQSADAQPAPSGNFGKASDLIGRYADLGLPVWVTEYGASDHESSPEAVAAYLGALTRQLKADPRVRVAIQFCLLDAMVPGFGLVASNGTLKPQWWAYETAALDGGRGGSTMPEFKLGFKTFADAHPEVGKPLEDEHYLAGDDHYSLQMSEGGLLVYSKEANAVRFLPGKA